MVDMLHLHVLYRTVDHRDRERYSSRSETRRIASMNLERQITAPLSGYTPPMFNSFERRIQNAWPNEREQVLAAVSSWIASAARDRDVDFERLEADAMARVLHAIELGAGPYTACMEIRIVLQSFGLM
jgi:hypothetical protein